MEMLDNRDTDIILMDMDLPDGSGLGGGQYFTERCPDVPVIVLSGNADKALAMRAVESGAQDYLVKGRFDKDLLVRAIGYAIERKRALARLLEAPRFDTLTGAVNRSCFMTLL